MSDKPCGVMSSQTMAMPADANASGDIFGGWLLSEMDIAGSIIAQRMARGRVVTIAIDGMSFLRPVLIGDTVSCYSEITKIGKTSIKVKVQAWSCRPFSSRKIKVTEGLFTYVAIDETRQPVPVGKKLKKKKREKV